MSKITLTSFAKRGSMLVAAAGLVVATIAPAAVFADALNPLTERSLLLSSSAPGYQDTDGSGNSTDNPNPAASTGINPGDPGYVPGTYAPAGSGANGRKTGQTFSFRVSSTATINAFTLQYCTQAAGLCQAPGNNDGDFREGGDYVAVTNVDGRKTNQQSRDEGLSKSDLDVNYPAAHPSGAGAGGFTVEVDGTDSPGWVLNATNREDTAHTGDLTGKRNYITLTNATGVAAAANDKIVIKFTASETNYITNPGANEFFVKMNTYDDVAAGAGDIIDGGVTVANVMTDSIHITTKVLETMQFSVGTENPDNDIRAQAQDHGTCENIKTPNGNRLELGNVNAEHSLQTDRGFGVYSYWRLSSNSSGGATVYYSGETLSNTVGDQIAPAGGVANPGTQVTSLPGTEQFGLAFATHEVSTSTSFIAALAIANTPYRQANLYVLNEEAAYADGDGSLGINGTGGETPTAKFAFDRGSLTNPVPIADNIATGGVLTCETAKMRYIANIAADTPAGVYTTKINYLAAPQY